jgi:hypothetical protein
MYFLYLMTLINEAEIKSLLRKGQWHYENIPNCLTLLNNIYVFYFYFFIVKIIIGSNIFNLVGILTVTFFFQMK